MSALYLILALACAWGCLRCGVKSVALLDGWTADAWALAAFVLFCGTVLFLIATVKAAFSGGA